jgi:CDP-diacylglycerol---glycerol-3-phosphate 3-phosphatidyltransferase
MRLRESGLRRPAARLQKLLVKGLYHSHAVSLRRPLVPKRVNASDWTTLPTIIVLRRTMTITKESTDASPPKVLNVPNQLTLARLALSVVVFALIGVRWFATATVMFVIAASTDWIDGYYARKYGQVTKLGRILDPFVDKIIICGAFIFLVAEPYSGVKPWMAVLVVAREILVTALRSYIEQHGGDFSATMSGKLKMVFQCIAVVASLVALWYGQPPRPIALDWILLASVWIAVLSTLYSGAVYVVAAIGTFRE